MKHLSFLFICLFTVFVPAVVFGQDVAAAAVNTKPAGATQFNDIMQVVLLVLAATVVVVSLIIMLKTNMLLYKQVMKLEDRLQGIPEAVAPTEPTGDDFWTRMRKKYWENPVPLAQEHQIQMHHDYDGIRELDNSLPPWWVNMFYATIVFAGLYMWYYHFSDNGASSTEEYMEQVAYNKKQRAMALFSQANAVDESNVTALADVAKLGEGEIIYKANCAACHGQNGEGGVGPNMTDPNWIHGGGIKNVFKTIKYGVPAKGMIAWQDQLRPADMQKVASYILTLAGTNPANAKEPQGQVWRDSSAQDTTQVALPAR